MTAAQAATNDVPGQPGPSGGATQAIWVALGAAVFMLLGVLGRETVVDDQTLSLIWPAAGAGILLFGLTEPRRWPLAAALVGLTTYALNVLTGVAAAPATAFLVANVLEGMAGGLVLRRMSPELLGAGGEEPLAQLRDLWSVLAACLTAAVVGAVSGSLGFVAAGQGGSVEDLVVWWGSDFAGASIVAVSGLLLLDPLRQVARAHDRPARWREHRAAVAARGLELLLLVGFTAALFLAVFVPHGTLPVVFPLLVPTVWVGLRFSPLTVVVHSLAVSVTVVAFTLHGRGPFGSGMDVREAALVAQLFVMLAVGLGTVMALSRAERVALTHTLSSATAAFQRQATLMAAIIDTMHDGLSLIDQSGEVLMRNPAGAGLVRAERDLPADLRESPFTMLTPEGRVLRGRDYPWVRAVQGEDVVEQDIVLVFDDGSPSRTLAVSARRLPTLDDSGLTQAVVIYHDVTQDRAHRTSLESFAQVVAHDLRGPVGVIQGWVEVLTHDLEEGPGLHARDAGPKLERIRSASERMQRLIADLLEASMSRDQQVRTAVVDLESVARSVADQHTAAIGAHRPSIEVGPMPDVRADVVFVRQLLDNLVSNAVKYVVPGEAPQVSVTAREVGEVVEVTVADKGIGIPASEREQIFEAFHRTHAAQGYDGHGIGLSVCRRIVERHGGRISARPALGSRGARIVFTLPAVRVPSDDPRD